MGGSDTENFKDTKRNLQGGLSFHGKVRGAHDARSIVPINFEIRVCWCDDPFQVGIICALQRQHTCSFVQCNKLRTSEKAGGVVSLNLSLSLLCMTGPCTRDCLNSSMTLVRSLHGLLPHRYRQRWTSTDGRATKASAHGAALTDQRQMTP